ncbi:hypothetical protein F0U44_12580 [Nocardioides humilatus]|uniref:WD40 repeat domain-containing protein n=1 Tax=Nocardioides humilatus TaxID=2607660 RepID=A0A5B1LF33_9ACTN|nr:hypothetical protein [Nocardioides humilatus]KAA1419275.1 hypothetical protein F0U44_12580 [Nocardioides humilatus]
MRRIVLGALALVLVVVLAVIWVATRGDDAEPRARSRPSDKPASGPREVYRLGEAAAAVPGEDYEVLQQIPGQIAHQSVLLLPDRTLVLTNTYRYGEAGLPLPDLVAVWDPDTGVRQNLPARWPRHFSRVTASGEHDLWVSFAGPGPTGKVHRVVHYDLRTGQDEVLTVPDVANAKSKHVIGAPYGAADGRIYFLTGTEPCLKSRPRCDNPHDAELWSFAPSAPDLVRKEADDVGEFAVSPTHLTWVDSRDSGDDEDFVLHVRRHGSDRVHQATVRDCWYGPWVPVLQTRNKRVLLQCGRLFDTRAHQVARLHIYSHDLSGMGNRWIAWGWTILQPDTGRLLQISDGRIWHQRPVAMSGDLILFPTGTEPPNTRNGTWTLARLAR